MAQLKLIVLFLSLSLLYICCDKVNSSENKQNELGGDSNISINTVGNEINVFGVVVGDTAYDLGQTITVTKFQNNITTLNVKADLSKSPELAPLLDYIPAQYKDSLGRIDANLDFKFTSEGVQDFTNRDHNAHTIIKYDCKVGDHYDYTKSNGQTIHRTVTERSETDDFPLGFMYIKTITIEQDSRIPGVKKIIFKANHRFGLVYMEMVMEDGTSAHTTFYD